MHKFQQIFATQPSNSDKIKHHGYQRIYPWFVNHFVDQEINLLEIGIEEGTSFSLWANYFKNINIYAIDREVKAEYSKNVKTFKVDQSASNELKEFCENVGVSFNFIIDDGSHVPEHQILTLKELWRLLLPGGVYIIEDIETSYWGKSKIYGYDFDSNYINTISHTIKFVDYINSEFSNVKGKDLENEIEMISFAYNCVILVKKDPDNFSNYYDRNYRFHNMINIGD